MDRPRVVGREPDPRYEAIEAPDARSFPSAEPYMYGELSDEPITPRSGVRKLAGKLAAPLVLLGGLVLKFGGSLKFLGIFVSVGGYALLWGWPFALGIVLLILAHELGHYVEARRLGLNPALPVFVPFLGAYVALREHAFDPVRNARVTIAGPIVGGLATGVVLAAAAAVDSRFLFALAYTGFLLNLFNMIPVGFLDGGRLLRSWRALRFEEAAAPGRRRGGSSTIVAAASIATVCALAAGMYFAHVPQDRL